MLLRRFFYGADGFSKVGVVLGEGDIVFMLLAIVWQLLADADGIRAIMDAKGSSGLLPCFKCKNVLYYLAAGYNIGEYCVSIGCGNPKRFDECDDKDHWDRVGHLLTQRPLVNKTALEKMETNLGINCNPLGVVADVELREFVPPSKVVRYETMHCVFQNGSVSVEFRNFLEAVRAHRPTVYQDLGLLLEADWSWP